MGDQFAYVGSYTVENKVRDRFVTNSKGIEVFRISGSDGAWSHIQTMEQLNPMYLMFGTGKRTLYAASSDSNQVYAYGIDRATGMLHLLNTQTVGGNSTLCLGISGDGRHLVVGSISGDMACIEIKTDGGLGRVCDDFKLPGEAGPLKGAQPWPRPHHSVFDPDGRFCYIVDKGKDTVGTYEIESGSGKLNGISELHTRPGSCARHIVFHPNRRFAYINTEYIGTVLSCHWEPEAGTLETFQILPTIPEDYVGNYSLSSEIEIHPNGRFLYVSNRGHDSLAIFRIDEVTGKLTALGWQKTLGSIPRYFSIEPGGNYLYICNQGDGEIKSFAIDGKTGLLTYTGQTIKTATPVWLLISGAVKQIQNY